MRQLTSIDAQFLALEDGRTTGQLRLVVQTLTDGSSFRPR